MTEQDFTIEVERRRQEPLKIIPAENLEKTLRHLQGEEEFAARLIYRLANINIFRLKWQDVEETEGGWKIHLNDRTATLHEEDITSELEKRKAKNSPLLNTTEDKLREQLPAEVKPKHLKHGGLLHLLQKEDCRLLELHKRTGYAATTIRKRCKQFRLAEFEDAETDFKGQEYGELQRYFLDSGELTVLIGENRPRKIMPEEKLNDLVDRFHEKRYAMATRLLFRGGLRLSEGLELTWEDLEQKENCWEADINAGRSDRTVYITGEKLNELLEEFEEDEGQVFDFSQRAFRNKLHQRSDGDIKPHTLRISRAYDLASKPEFSRNDLQAFFGWTTPKSAEKYQDATIAPEAMEVNE